MVCSVLWIGVCTRWMCTYLLVNFEVITDGLADRNLIDLAVIKSRKSRNRNWIQFFTKLLSHRGPFVVESFKGNPVLAQ